MSRNALALLLVPFLAAPSLAAPVEIPRAALPAAGLGSAASAGASVTALTAPSLTSPASSPTLLLPAPAPAAAVSAAPAPQAAPAAAAPHAAPASAPALHAAPAAAPAVSAGPAQWAKGSPEARGPPAAPRTFASVAKTVADTVRAWAPVEDIFRGHDVLLLGENHGSLESVQTLTREMPRLAAAGVRAVGIEGLKRPDQAAVDAYLDGRSDVLPDSVLDFSPRRRQAFQSLFRAARRDGVRVVALGMPLELWARAAAELAARNTGRPADSFPDSVDAHFERASEDYEQGYNEAVAQTFLTDRNRSMASFVADAIRHGGKAVVLVGQAHVDGLDMVPGRLLNAPGDWGTLARELAHFALRAFSLTQTGGLFVSVDAAKLDRATRPKSYTLAADMTPDGAPRFVPLGPDRGLWHAGGRVPTAPAFSH